jgi:hypothetical protein
LDDPKVLLAAKDVELCDLLAEGKAALSSSPIERVSNALTVLPKLVAALDRVALYQTELRDVRRELTVEMRALRMEIWAAQRIDPSATFRGGPIQKHFNRMLELIDRAGELLHTPEPR